MRNSGPKGRSDGILMPVQRVSYPFLRRLGHVCWRWSPRTNQDCFQSTYFGMQAFRLLWSSYIRMKLLLTNNFDTIASRSAIMLSPSWRQSRSNNEHLCNCRMQSFVIIWGWMGNWTNSSDTTRRGSSRIVIVMTHLLSTIPIWNTILSVCR